jgi:hypothetical protein
MFRELFLFKIHKNREWYNRIIILLVCILIAILYLHGEDYAHCKCIYPDEIMDLQCSIFLSRLKHEETICYASRDDIQFIPSVDIQIFSIYSVCIANASFFNKYCHLQDFKKRLFLLQRYNS